MSELNLGKPVTNNRQSGQALIELVICGTSILGLAWVVATALWYSWIRLEMAHLALELSACFQSTHSNLTCEMAFRQASAKLPGQIKIASVRETHDSIEIELSALSFSKWKIKEPRHWKLK